VDSLTEQLVELTSRLIERPSVTPDDAGCQELIGGILTGQGFRLESLPYGEVRNLWATHGSGRPILLFAGHTDVVPSGPADQWRSDPFVPTVAGEYLYGRGSADMKGSLAAMLHATAAFLHAHPDHHGTIAYLITSDEEGDAVDGTNRVVDWLASRDLRPEFCLVGEPSSSEQVGDVIRIGRRGSLNGRLLVSGTQGHVAYPDQADNPIHKTLDTLKLLTGHHWDHGNEAFPPTSFQISNIHAGTGASNVIPGTLEVRFNLRYSTEQSAAGLEQQIDAMLAGSGLDYVLEWNRSGPPFLTATPWFVDAVSASVRAVQSFDPERSTGGGTSDGRFIARLGTQIVELGPVNATIHSVDECTRIPDLTRLCRMYEGVLTRVLAPTDA
jgi:succinyl-diaminopimelate desuccinylase